MPRGRKHYTPEEKLDRLSNEIENAEQKLSELKKEKRALEKQMKQEQLNQLYELILESGKTVGDVKDILFTNPEFDNPPEETA